MFSNSQQQQQDKIKPQSTLLLSPDDEIKQLKEYIKIIYFKENEDSKLKAELVNDINDLELIKYDEDFYYHLQLIYDKVVSRQEQNLDEFQEYSNNIERLRKDIERKDEEIIKILDDHTQYKINNVKNNLKIIDQSLITLENELFQSKDDLNHHIEKICSTVQKSKQEFDNSINSINELQQMNEEFIQNQKKLQDEQKIQILIKTKEQQELKQQMEQHQKSLDLLCKQIENFETKETKLSIIQQSQKEKEILKQKKDELDKQISIRKQDLTELQLDNTIVEKRQAYFVQQFASDYIKGRQKDELISEVDRIENEYNNLRLKIDQIQENTKNINEQIILVRNKKQYKQNINLFLIFIILLISFTLLYKFY